MPIISRFEDDHSDAICKVYAQQALKHLEQGAGVGSEATQVPLANLFRLFEMYRYDAFDDEKPSSVLALDEVGIVPLQTQQPWHVAIKAALDTATAAVFANDKDAAVTELQDVLRQLASNQLNTQAAALDRQKAFYREFSASIPA